MVCCADCPAMLDLCRRLCKLAALRHAYPLFDTSLCFSAQHKGGMGCAQAQSISLGAPIRFWFVQNNLERFSGNARQTIPSCLAEQRKAETSRNQACLSVASLPGFSFWLSSAGKPAKQVKAEGARGLLRGAAQHPLTRQKAKPLHYADIKVNLFFQVRI